jgi:hypothetical protein
MRERALGSARLENQTYKSLLDLKGYSGCKDPNNNNRNPSCIYNSTSNKYLKMDLGCVRNMSTI